MQVEELKASASNGSPEKLLTRSVFSKVDSEKGHYWIFAQLFKREIYLFPKGISFCLKWEAFPRGQMKRSHFQRLCSSGGGFPGAPRPQLCLDSMFIFHPSLWP